MARKTTDELLRDRLRELGAIGGKSAAKLLSKEERSKKAQLAAKARWTKAKKKPKPEGK